MNPLSCEQAALLLDLHAAGECAPADDRAVRAHLDTCAACRAELAEARRLLGLLDVHFHQDRALRRLAQVLAAERTPRQQRPVVLSFVQRFAAVAALVLVTFGLTVGLMPLLGPERWSPPQLNASLVPRRSAEMVRVAPGKRAAKDAVTLHAKSLAELKKAVEAGRQPLPPRIDLDLVLRNPGPAPLEVQVGGPGFALVPEVAGQRVLARSCPWPDFVPFPPRKLTIAPGGSAVLRVERLAAQIDGRAQCLYPTAGGEHTLRIRLRTVAGRPGWPASRRALKVEAGPITLVVRPERE